MKLCLVAAHCFISLILVGNVKANSSMSMAAIVSSKSGVVQRTNPTINSSKIIAIPYEAEIEILGYSKQIDSINGMFSKWYNVKYLNKEGWVFGGYISIRTSSRGKEQEKIDSFCNSPIKKVGNFQRTSSHIVEDIKTELGSNCQLYSEKYSGKHNSNKFLSKNRLKYKDVFFEFISIAENKQILTQISISGNDNSMKYDINIGDDIDKLYNIFGLPNQVIANTYCYYSSGDRSDFITFYIDDYKIIKIDVIIEVD